MLKVIQSRTSLTVAERPLQLQCVGTRWVMRWALVGARVERDAGCRGDYGEAVLSVLCVERGQRRGGPARLSSRLQSGGACV